MLEVKNMIAEYCNSLGEEFRQVVREKVEHPSQRAIGRDSLHIKNNEFVRYCSEVLALQFDSKVE